MAKNIIFVLFGATGDLAQKKIIPALETLTAEGGFSAQSRVIAVSRRDWDDAGFVNFYEESVKRPVSSDFKKVLAYTKVDIDAGTGYDSLSARIADFKKEIPDAEVIIHLSLAPHYHTTVLTALFEHAIAVRGQVKVLIEKPFGTDLGTARALDAFIGARLNESDIYRIDHYLSKQAAQDIMNANRTQKKIVSIRARLLEDKGIDGRGASYDGVGAFRDVGQNHMLEMVALVLAQASGDWQSARESVITRLVPPEDTCVDFRRGQYVGYHDEKGVPAGSETETAFHVVTMLDRVLITLESGKKMGKNEASVVVTYADKTTDVFDFRAGRDAYITMIESAIKGQKREFVGLQEVLALWNYADHVQRCWDQVPLEIYSADKPFLVE